MKPLALAAALGKQLQAFREARGLRQDDVARSARHTGLAWTRVVVRALEAGRRYLTIDEFARLPLILELLGAPPGEPEARLESHGALAQLHVIPLLQPTAQRISMVVPLETMPALASEDTTTGQAAYRGAAGDLEQKLARRVRLDPLIVALVAFKTWGRSLTEERDARVAAQAPADTARRALRGIRGHVTRALVAELAPQLTAARQRLRRKKGARR